MEPNRKPSPNRPTPAKVNQRRNQPGSWSPKGSHQVPNLTNARSPNKKPSDATSQLNTVFGIGRMSAYQVLSAWQLRDFPDTTIVDTDAPCQLPELWRMQSID